MGNLFTKLESKEKKIMKRRVSALNYIHNAFYFHRNRTHLSKEELFTWANSCGIEAVIEAIKFLKETE